MNINFDKKLEKVLNSMVVNGERYIETNDFTKMTNLELNDLINFTEENEDLKDIQTKAWEELLYNRR